MVMRSLARRAMRKAGFEKIHHPSVVDLMCHEGIATVIDVGANEGHYGVDLRERGFAGRIVSFEPIPSVYRLLAARAAADPTWEAHQLGVGDEEGELPISVSAATVFSSFKPPTGYTRDKFEGAKEARRETVPVVRLDRFLADRPELLGDCFLKVDTQGFEREVLEGGAIC